MRSSIQTFGPVLTIDGGDSSLRRFHIFRTHKNMTCNYSGTPFKKLIVALGLIVILVYVLWLWWSTNSPQTREDRTAIKNVYIIFENSIRQDDFAHAYMVMSPSYTEQNTLELFTTQFSFIQKGEESLTPEHFISVNGDEAWLWPKGSTQRHGAIFEFEKLVGKWYLTGKIGIIHD